MLEVFFWGVRGSVPTPGPSTVGVGGNTSCVEVRAGGQRIVLDAGTGLRPLGEARTAEGLFDTTLLLSHLHWDHIQGLPFYTPLFRPGTSIRIHGPGMGDEDVEQSMITQMRAPNFPVPWQALASNIECTTLRGGESFAIGDVQVRCARLNHPGGVLGYRLEHAGRSVVYATDTEHYAALDPTLLELSRDADVLIYDAMYTDAEYAGEQGMCKIGWGHSTWQAATAMAEAAGVGQLVLFHHDPSRTDEQVMDLEKQARERFEHTLAAREGRIVRAEQRERKKKDTRAA